MVCALSPPSSSLPGLPSFCSHSALAHVVASMPLDVQKGEGTRWIGQEQAFGRTKARIKKPTHRPQRGRWAFAKQKRKKIRETPWKGADKAVARKGEAISNNNNKTEEKDIDGGGEVGRKRKKKVNCRERKKKEDQASKGSQQ
jgi:hypothetical protein